MTLLNETLETKVAQIIRERILKGDDGFAPGARLFVGDVARDLGVSITPVQYALKSLVSEGLIEARPRKGAFVADLEPDGVLEIWEAMLALQVGCLTLAEVPLPGRTLALFWENIDAAKGSLDIEDWRGYLDRDIDFHRMIVGITGNSLSLSAYDGLVVRLRHLLLTYIDYQRMDHGREGLAGHQRMVRLLEGTNTAGAIHELIEDHRQSVKRLSVSRELAVAGQNRR